MSFNIACKLDDPIDSTKSDNSFGSLGREQDVSISDVFGDDSDWIGEASRKKEL